VLLVWGDAALELWNVPVSVLQPGKPLAEEHRLWRQAAPPGAAPDGTAFALVPQAALWSAGGRLFRREAASEAPPAEQPLFTAEEKLGGFAPAPGGASIATFLEGGKILQLFSGMPPQPSAALKGHRFPIAAAEYSPGGTLMSVDTGRNLILWRDGGPRIDFLKALPERAEPAGLIPLAEERVALLLREGGDWTLAVLEGAERKISGSLPVPPRPRVAMSATGRYVVTAAENELKLYVFAHPISPVGYVRRLREWGAMPAALGYARMLDPDQVSSALRRQVEEELNRVPSERVLAELLERLRSALDGQDLAAIQQWADQVLALQPGHPEAVQALLRLRGLRERQILAQAREAYESGFFGRAIDLLASRIPPASEHAAEAARLIRLAEEKRAVQITLDQARERMEAGLYDAAETLVNEALRQDPESREALRLQSEIRGRSGRSLRELILLGLGALLALAALGFLLRRYRGAWRVLLRPLSLDQDASLRPPPLGAERMQARAARPQAEPAGVRAGGGSGPPRGQGPLRDEGRVPRSGEPARSGLARALRLEEARDTLDKAEQLLRLCRQSDRFQEHTAYFLELEAELNTLARRLNDRNADPERLLGRLNKILADLRNVKFKTPQPEQPAREQPEELDYYQLLRVPAGASEAEIRAAYHRLIKEYHPDRHSSSEYAWIKEESERMSRKLSEAYQVLSDAARREQYDRELAQRSRASP
jgi:DnaJ-domain-containing protein 1